jgi:hypothetical protein
MKELSQNFPFIIVSISVWLTAVIVLSRILGGTLLDPDIKHFTIMNT